MRRLLLLLLSASLLPLQLGCGGCGDEPLSLGHLDAVPAEARSVALVDLGRLAESIRSFSPFRRFEGRWRDLGDELNALLEARFGLGLLDAQGLVAWALDAETWGALVLGDFDAELPGGGPTVSGNPATELEDGTLLIIVDGELLAGSRDGLERMLAVLEGRSASLDDADSDDAELLRDLLGDVGGEVVSMAGVSGDLDELLRPVAPDARGVAASVSDRAVQLRLRLPDGEAAERIAAQMTGMLSAAVQTMGDRADALRDDEDEAFDEVMWAIAGDHAARLAADELVVIGDDGDDVVVDLDMSDMGGGVGLIGVLAAVAVPKFLDYVRRSKTSEARANVLRIHQHAMTYYAAYGQLPEPAPRTPAQVPCGETASTSEMWSHPSWDALDFRTEGDLRYSYQVDVEGQESRTTLTVSAFGDLDCDGELSTFFIEDRIGPDGVFQGESEVRERRSLE